MSFHTLSPVQKLLFIALTLFGMALIPIGDSAGKLLTQQGVSSGFVAWSRLVLGFMLVLPVSRIKAAEVTSLYNWRLLVRAGLFSCAIFCMLTALKTEPLADVFGIFFVGPMVAFVLASWLLKEQVTALRVGLIVLGFIGVLMVVKPGLGMSAGILFALCAGICYGSLLTANRWLAAQFRPRLILLSTLLAGSIALAPVGLTQWPTQFTTEISVLLLISSGASALGNLIIIEANRRMEASFVAPLVYTQLVVATLLSIGLFGDWPDTLAWFGLAVIIVSGVLPFLLKTPKAIKT